MEEQPIESENVEVVETTGGDDRGKRLQAVYSMLDSDEAYRPYVPATYDEFLGKIAKDRNYAQAIHKMVASDEVYSQYLPETFEETVSYFGLGKPSPTPRSGSGLGSTQSGGQMPMAQQPRSGASPSSAPVYLSPEELGAEAQMPTEEVIQTQTVQTEAPTPQELEPFKDPKVQDALRLEYLKKKAQKSKTESEAYKGSLLGGLYNSAIEGLGSTLQGGAYMLGVMFGGDSEQFGDETEDERIEAFTKKIEEVGIKKTIDELKSKGTTQEFIDKAKEEGGIIAQGVFGLAESAPAMLTPMQVGFLFSTFETAHKEMRKEMPDASPAAQFLYAATQGTVAMLLEKAGVSNLIQNKSVMKNLTGKIVNEIQQMGVKMTPEVVESTAAKLVNGFLAEAETGGLQYVSEESIKQIADALEGEKDVFKFEGWQQFLSNTVDAAAAEGIGGFVMKSLGEAASAIKSPADKQKVEQDKQQVADMMNDLSNPNVSPEAKQAISKKVDEKAEAILETYASEQNKIQGLSEEGKKEFTFLSDQSTSMEAVLADPNVSDATKQAVQADLEETNKKIETILSSAKETSVTEQPITNSQVNLDAIKSEIDRERKNLEENIKYEEDYIAKRKKKGALGKVKDWFLTEEWFPKKDNFLNSLKEKLNLLNNDPKKYFESTLKEQAEWSERNPDDSNEFLVNYYSEVIDKLNSTSNTLSDVESPISTEQQPTETSQPKVTVEEIKSLPLTRIEGAGMGSNQAVGTFISTEPENRYAKQFPDAEVQSMEVEIETPYVSEDTNMIDFRNELINRRKSELDETDFTEVEIPNGEFTISDLSDSGIEKVAGMVTEELKAQGYDSIYFPAIKSNGETQEGELVVFDREKVKRKDTPQTPQQDATQSGNQQQQLSDKPFVRAEDLGDSDVIRPNERIPPMFNGMTIPTKSNEVGRDIIISIPIEMMDDKSSMIVNPTFFATDFAESLIRSGKSFDDIVFSPFKSSIDNGSASPRTELSLSSMVFSTTKNDISAQLARLSPNARKSAILLVPGKFISSEFDSATLAYAIDGHRLIFTGLGAIDLPLSTPRVLPFELLRANGTTIHNFFLNQSNVPLNKGISNSIKSEIENDSKRQIQQNDQQQREGIAGSQQGKQANRDNQKADVAPSQAETSGGNSVAEGGKKKEVAIEDIDDAAVDKADQTIIAYHATPTGKVSTGKEAGIHIGTKKAAEQVKAGRNQGKGTVEKVKITIKRPLVLSDMPSWSSANLLSQLYNPATGQYFGLTRNDVRDIRDSDMTEKQKQQSIIDFLKRKGYDAIAYKNDSEDAGSYSYVLFEEPTIEGGGTVLEGTEQVQASTQQEVTPEQQQRINTRSLLSEISDWNKLGSKAKRSPEGVTEMQRLQKAGKELGLTVDTKAIKSGLRLVATNADGQVMTVEKVNKVMNPKRVVWSDANYAVQETTDANGNKVIEFYDAKTGDQIRSNSKEGAKAKEAYYEGNIQKFLGKDKPIDVDTLLDFYDGDEESFNKAVLEAVAESDNAFEIAANYKNFVKHDDALTTTMYDPTFELAQLVGQMSEEDFKENFDKNFLNKNSKWIDPNYRGEPLDSRISAWVDLDNEKSDSPFAASLRGRDASSILRDITDLVQGYPDGPQSVRQSKEGELLPFASQRFRQITGKPLNPVTAYEFNEMFNRYAENADRKEFGFASKVAWEDLTPQQKQEIIDEQTKPVEDEFFFEGTDFENQPELFAENEQDQGGAEEFPTEEQRDEIEEDGFAMPTDEEMAAKRDEIQTDLQKAIQDVKDKFGDLFNQNLGIAYDPKVEARKLYNFHVALVNLAKTAIRSGITTAADFAKTLGKRLDKFTERAFNDAMNDLNGDPMIINSEQDMLNAEYQRVAESYAKQREDAKKLKKPFLKRFIEGINAGWFDANYVSKKLLGDVGGYEAIKAKNLLGGASAKAKMQYDTFKREIFGGLNSAEKKLLNDIIQARTIISIDNRYDAKGKQRIKHPGDTNKESQAIFLGQIEESQPELFKKLNDRAEKYFNAQRELLDERLKEGRISIEQYQGMIDNDYSPRVFLEYLIDDAESGSGLTSGGQGSVGRSDIKSLSDGDVNSLFHNAEWLLASNVLATSRSIFHNRANRSLYELAKANPNNGFIEIQNPNGFNKETGQPTYKDPRSDQRQIQFFENGVRKSMLATREFGESWNNNNPLLSPQYANAIRIASGGVYKRLFATGINPLFALSNLPRDIAHSLFFTNAYSPTFPVALAQISSDLVRTAKDAWKFNRSKDKDGRYYKYTMQGDGMDFLATQGLPFEQQALIQSTAKDAMDATVKVLGYINNSSEIWVRLAIREREANKLTAKFARDNGRMPNDAEKESIETSATEVARSQMDFSQGGRWAKAMDNLIPYLNASLQGLRVSARYARENPKVFSYKVAQALAVSAAIAAYNMRFKDDYDDLEDEEKNRNIIIMLDFYKTVDGKKRRAYIRIPKNQSSQWIFAMGEIMGESMAAKEFRPRKGASTLQTLMPPYDPRNIPVIDALNTYETGYDRFREKYVYSKDYTGFEYAEYEENKTAWLWRDIGKQLGLSPIRLKAAVGKLTADPDNNMIWVAVTEGYDKLIKSVPEDEQKSINDMAVESMEQMLTPVQRKFLAFTNPDSKSKSIRELEASEATKIKLQNDTVKNYVKKYINDEMTETEARSAFNEWLNTQPKDSVNTKRLKTRFENSIQFKDVDNVFYRMSETKYPEVKARLLFDAYLNAPDDDAREVLLFQAKNNPNVPKDKSSSFWKEFNRLKALGEE